MTAEVIVRKKISYMFACWTRISLSQVKKYFNKESYVSQAITLFSLVCLL